MPTSTPLPTAVPLIPMPTTGPCVVASSGAERVNVRETPSTDGTILGSILINSTVPATAIVEIDETFAWVITPLGFISESALRFGGENCERLAKLVPPSSAGPFILRHDTDDDGMDDTQYLSIKLEDVLISSATGESAETTGFDPDDTLIFWPPFEPTQIGLLLPAVQAAREAAARMGDGCGDTTVFNPTTGVPGCVFGGSDILIFCTMQYCVGQQTTTTSNNLKQLGLATFQEIETASSAAAHVKVFDGRTGADIAPGSLIPELIFIPRPPTDNNGGTSGEAPCIDPGEALYGQSVGGCVLLGTTLVAWCVGDWCLYHEY
jgi:hypothetical protein